MDEHQLKKILTDIQNKNLSIEEGFQLLKDLPYEDIGVARLDHHRSIRKGFPEVIYGEGKTEDQIIAIYNALLKKNNNILITRLTKEIASTLVNLDSQFIYNPIGKLGYKEVQPLTKSEGKIVIVSGGTSDLPVVEEAYVTAEILGNHVTKFIDVGVAGIHRILDKRKELESARVIIVVAGMEGALASVVAGLVEKPVIAVPTSIGYGANFGGLSALLGMLNSCSPSVLVVNIDNGFGAGYAASVINKSIHEK